MSAIQTANDVFQLVAKKIATSNRAALRIFEAIEKTDSSLCHSSTQSIARLSFQTSANAVEVSTVNEASGRPCLIARTAGKVAAACCAEAGETIRIRNGSSLERTKSGGKKTRRWSRAKR